MSKGILTFTACNMSKKDLVDLFLFEMDSDLTLKTSCCVILWNACYNLFGYAPGREIASTHIPALSYSRMVEADITADINNILFYRLKITGSSVFTKQLTWSFR